MLKIGDFARLAGVSVTTLRHYDDISLLKPQTIDPLTGYRFYSSKQLYTLNRILALKDLGLSLEQIKQSFVGTLNTRQLQDMLKRKQAEERLRLQETQERLTRIAAHLTQIEKEAHMPDYDIIVKNLPACLVASQRLIIPTNDDVPDYLTPAFKTVSDYIKSQNAKTTGACLTLWHTTSDTYTNEEVEVIFPIDRTLDGNENVKVYTLPAVQVASTIHQGDFDDFTGAHVALLRWIEDNGYKVSGPFREIYLEGNDESGESTTEVQFEVAKISA